jgi:aspartyl/asparaginyl-tRNA synthetase
MAAPVVTIEKVGEHTGQAVTIRGWLYNLRESGKLLFPIFRDGTGIIQGVVSLKENSAAFEAVKGLTQELLDLKSVAMKMTKQSEERSRQELKRGTIVAGTASQPAAPAAAPSSSGSTIIRPKGARQAEAPAGPSPAASGPNSPRRAAGQAAARISAQGWLW